MKIEAPHPMIYAENDAVHFPGDPTDRGTVFNDAGQLTVLWHRPCDEDGDPDMSPIDVDGRLLDFDGLPLDRTGPLRVEPVVH